MPVYKNFDQVINAGRVDEFARVAFTKNWLKTSYDITDVKADFIDALSDVHDHDDLAKHFGQVRVGTAFSSVLVQIVKVENVWHLGAILKDGEQGSVIHPKAEASFTHPENMKVLLLLKTVLSKGTVSKGISHGLKTGSETDGTLYTPDVGIGYAEVYAKQDAEDFVNEDIVSVKSNPNDLGIGKTKSVGIDLSAYL